MRREYWVNRRRPASPSSWFRALSFGTMTVKSCMIMEAVMKGPTPSITIDRFERPPPEKRFKRLRNSLPANRLWRRSVSISGIGMTARKREMAKIPSTNNIRPLRDLSPKISCNFSVNLDILFNLFLSQEFLKVLATQLLLERLEGRFAAT